MRWRHLLIAILALAGFACWLWLYWLERQAAHQPYSLIEENLYVGASVKIPPPGTKAVLNLCQIEDSYRVDTYCAEPIDGCEPPSIEWMRRNVKFIDEQRKAGNTVYVHCWAGMNRSGMLVTAYLMYEHGWSRDEALAFAQSQRPQIQPNIILMRALAEWERDLTKR